MENTCQKKKYYKPIVHNKGSKPFSSKEKSLFYTYMYNLYKELVGHADKLEKIEKWLKKYDGSEYALIECASLKKMLSIRSRAAIFRYDTRMGRNK